MEYTPKSNLFTVYGIYYATLYSHAFEKQSNNVGCN